MKKKAVFLIVSIVMCLIMVGSGGCRGGVREIQAAVVGNGPIKSIISNHNKINIDVLIKQEGDEGYLPLTAKSVVSGEIEIMAGIPSGGFEYAYVEYKINGFYYAPGYVPSYSAVIDTNDLPDGWNQLLVVGRKENQQIKGVRQVIFKVENKTTLETKAPRAGKTYELGRVPSYRGDYIPVLMYHDFQKKISKKQESGVVHPDLFEKQLKMLLEKGYTPINFKDLNLYIKGQGGMPLKPIIITADDGYLSNYEAAFPILKKHQVQATFFVTTRYVGVQTWSPHFTWKQAKEMEESGLIDIQSHTHAHQLLNRIPEDEMRHQVGVSIGMIEQNLGRRDVKVLAYPQFYNNEKTRQVLAEEGVELQVTSLAKNKPSTKPTNIQRIHVANYTRPEELIREIKKLTK